MGQILGRRPHLEQGLKAVAKDDLPEAEKQFRTALVLDLYSAAAHNNLGIVLLKNGSYYEAAWEFEYAARLAPQSPEPRQNLGVLYEETGRTGQAIEAYKHALEVAPKDIVTMRHLARAYIKSGEKSNRVRELLEELLGIPTSSDWDVWIRGQLVRLGREEDNSSDPFAAPNED